MSASRTPVHAGSGHSNSSSAATPAPPKMKATVPLTSVDHGHVATRSSSDNRHAPHAASSRGNQLNSPSSRSKRDSPAGTPTHHTKKTNSAGELDENGAPPAMRRSGGAAAAAAAENSSAGVKASDAATEKKGRRGSFKGTAKWFEGDKTNRPADKELNKDVGTVSDGVADQELARGEQAERAQRQAEQLAQRIANPPTGFQAALPRLNELDVTNSWDKLLRMIRNEYDMSCLTNCLARELDEDVAWNPELLLVQLTSDMMDAADLQKDSEVYVPVDASDIGQMRGGEVVRKRGEKVVPAQSAGGPAPEGAAAAAGTAGTASPKPKLGFTAPDPQAKPSPSKQQTPAGPRAAAGTTSPPPKKEERPAGPKRSGMKTLFKK
ncbi:hypothetical protein ABB37_02308 [Leptomonas pyrrhocoris]|uniref:Intraflagellar transport protein 43 n=1 Tax=Leptomonas pyrrhocoris TaxID=157538 RepID=A0A0M9G7P8_LEPPY|nr:hypothetical protein ABB37_02308 [Leptomonas pyrrhocoris]XP_015662716.1 hypothetical protein ABB37_02308 [Leptomonas pyrrhocoris]KPA84276.1 hypothetical protein ABB37_02308 [Leptomonas pyrrhocoris]KPA84277.1 hypothetical protein ABB37_02308 [Leptomonas pyrrhocoris]|eukprot:XP_015662715.1 hypothetical protein ABB37_02308 [Leptomonas pyrrhocoris]